MGLWYIAVLHEPIIDSDGDPSFSVPVVAALTCHGSVRVSAGLTTTGMAVVPSFLAE